MPSHLRSKVLHRLNLRAAPTSFSRAKNFIRKIDSRSSVECDGVEIVLRGLDSSRLRRSTDWALVKKGAKKIIAAAQANYDDVITKIVLQNFQFVQAFSHDKPLQTKSIVAKTPASVVLDCRTNRGGPEIPPAPTPCPMETPALPEDMPPLDPMFTGFITGSLPGSLAGSLAGSPAGSPRASPNPASFAAPHPSEKMGMSFSDAFSADTYGVLQGVAGNFEDAIEELHL